MADQEAGGRPLRCYLPHGPLPVLGVSILAPSLDPQELPDLLGLGNGQELSKQIAEAHSYAFNMGGSNILPLSDYKEAGRLLMERNMPDVLHNRQKEPIFMPETHLPTVPRVVDTRRFEKNKIQIDQRAEVEGSEILQTLGMKKGLNDLTQVKGDQAERELSEALKIYFAAATDKEVVIFFGPQIRKPNEGRESQQENDVVVIFKKIKTVLVIESKATLAGNNGPNAVAQIQRLKEILREFFAQQLASEVWCFVGMIYTNAIDKKLHICADCSQHIINGPAEVSAKLDNIRTLVNNVRPQEVISSHSQYASLVQGFTFVVLSQPISTFCTITDDVHDKLVGKPASGKSKGKAGQGDFQSIIFWTNEQANIMLTVLQFVFFISPWSTGKTLLMREKAVTWAKENPTKKLYFVVVRHPHTK